MTPGINQLFKAFIQSFGDMGDIIDMAIKANDGKATYEVGEVVNSASTGTIASITASSTKDLYLAGASASILNTPTTANRVIYRVELLKNTTTIDVWSFDAEDNTVTINKSRHHPFNIKGAKVTTSETFRVVMAAAGGSYDAYAMIYGWQEDTGVSPQI